MNRDTAVTEFAVHFTRALGTLHGNRKLGKEIAVQAAGLEVRLCIRGHG
jgi:hypothetical protein